MKICVFWPDNFFQPIYRLHSVHWLPDAALSTCGSLDACDSCIRSAPNVKCIYYGNMVDRPRAVQRCFNPSLAMCPRSTIYTYIRIYVYTYTCTCAHKKSIWKSVAKLADNWKSNVALTRFPIHPSRVVIPFRNNRATVGIYSSCEPHRSDIPPPVDILPRKLPIRILPLVSRS